MQNELIPVAKAGYYLEVHPTALAAHKALGWSECARQAEAVDVPSEDKPEKAMTVAEMRGALTAKGIDIPDGIKKAELRALLESSN